MGWVRRELVEVDDAVKLVGRSDPLIDGLAHGLPFGGLVFGADERCQRCTDDFDALGVGAECELAETGDEVLCGDDVVGFVGVGGVADVVDALHDDDVFDACLGDDISVKACEGGGTGVVVEDAAAADAFVEYAELVGFLVGLEAAREDVGPTGVGVAGAESAVGDAVAEGDDGGAVVVGEDVNAFEKVPAEELLRSIERGSADHVACREVVRLVREGVKGELIDGLVGEEEADGEIREGSDFEGDWIADHQGTGRNDDGGLSAEGEWRSSACGNAAAARAERDLRRADGERIEAEFISQDDSDGIAAKRDVDDLSQGGAGRSFGSELCPGVVLGHGRGGPGADPVVRLGGEGRLCGEAVEAEEQ